jgi:hypothetical protein
LWVYLALPDNSSAKLTGGGHLNQIEGIAGALPGKTKVDAESSHRGAIKPAFMIHLKIFERWPRSNSKCNNSIELIHGDSRSRAVGKWETSFVFHLFHGCFVPSHGQS